MVSYTIQGGHLPIRVTLDPDDAPAAVSALLLELAGDPEVGPGTDLLIDAGRWSGQWEPRELDRVMPAFRELVPQRIGAIAIVAERPVAYGMSRMLAVHLETAGLVAAVFRTLPEANAWIAGHREGDSAERRDAE